ncbi:MAG: SCO family protein [Pseudomonadota bacterium]|nr:SCO family protein [Pseudomonadota bacterium]
MVKKSFFCLIITILSLSGCIAKSPKPVFKAMDITGAPWGGNFSLNDTQGNSITLASYRGKAVMLFFGYTHCPDECPDTMSKLNIVMHELGPSANHVQVLFATVDPERDTSAVLAHWLHQFNPSFIGLEGTLAQMKKTAADFHIFFSKHYDAPGSKNYSVDHSDIIYVYDTKGRIRLAMPITESSDDMTQDMKTLLSNPV